MTTRRRVVVLHRQAALGPSIAVDRGVRLVARRRDDDALAGRQAVGLDDDGRAAPCRRSACAAAASVKVS